MNEIEFDNVSFSYDGARPVLAGVSLSVARGEFMCIVGPNGSGKSTLARHMNGLLVPNEGTVRIAGVATSDRAGRDAARRRVGMVFQNPDDALVETLVEDDVAFGPRNLGVPADEVRMRVDAALASVGMAGFERHDTVALSLGQKQRVAIAGVLALQPDIVVLDEATASLDPRGRRDVAAIARHLHEQGMTVVSVTQSMEEVAALATRVIALARGAVAFDGAPETLLADEQLLSALSLEAPYEVRLVRALREAGIEVSAPLGAAPEKMADAIAQSLSR